MFVVKVNVQSRVEVHRIKKFPCTIGRSLSSDVPVLDDSVSANHARIESMEFGYRLIDLESTNGILQDGEKSAEVYFEKNVIVHLGDVKVELILEEAIGETRITRTPRTSAGRFRIPRWVEPVGMVLLATLFLYLSILFVQFCEYWPPDNYHSINESAITLWAGLFFVSLIASLIIKVNTRSHHFQTVFSVAIVTVGCYRIFQALEPTIMFNLSWPILQSVFQLMTNFAFVWVPVYVIVYVAGSVANRRRNLVWCGLVALGLTGFMATFEWVSARGDQQKNRRTYVGYPIVGHEARSERIEVLQDLLSLTATTIKDSRDERRKDIAKKKKTNSK